MIGPMPSIRHQTLVSNALTLSIGEHQKALEANPIRERKCLGPVMTREPPLLKQVLSARQRNGSVRNAIEVRVKRLPMKIGSY
jgi:hypothetical protein